MPTSAEHGPGKLENPSIGDRNREKGTGAGLSSAFFRGPVSKVRTPNPLLWSVAAFFRFPICGLQPSLFILLISSAFLLSCSGSSPRFRTDDAGTVDTDEIRFASKIKEEEQREDDRKVDLSAFQKGVGTGKEDLTPAGINRDAVLLDVVSYLGVPYRYGGATKNGIDCSGFTSTIYRNALSIALPRTAREQFGAGSPVDGDGLQFGDLVFFNTTGQGVSHVGIYLEDDLFAHASVSYGVTISSLESTYYRKRFLGAKRVAQ